MTLKIDGTKPSDIKIDGTDVQEVKIDGTTVWKRGENIYVAANNSRLYKLDQDQNLAWSKNYSDGNTLAVATNPSEDVVVGYQYNLVRKLNSAGTEQWTYSTNNNVRAVAFDENGYVYAGTDETKLYKWDSNGNLQWSNYLSSGGNEIWSIAVKSGGYIYVGTGNTSTDTVYMVDRTGTEIDYISSSDFGLSDIALYGSYIFLANQSNNGITVYENVGDAFSTSRVEHYSTPEGATGVSADDNGNIYACSYNDVVYKLSWSPNTLTENWSTSVNNNPRDVEVAPGTYNSYTVPDNAQQLNKLNSLGTSQWTYGLDTNGRAVAVVPGLYGTFPGEW